MTLERDAPDPRTSVATKWRREATGGQQELIQLACERSAEAHAQLCPRQVLGVRIGLALTTALGRSPDPAGRGMLVVVETEGCFVDGITAATGCTVGHRTLRVEPYGRVAASALDLRTGRAVRAAPQPGIRRHAVAFACGTTGARPMQTDAVDVPTAAADGDTARAHRWAAQLEAYQRMPEADLLRLTPVRLHFDPETLPGVMAEGWRGRRVDCDGCGEEVLDHRERRTAGRLLCPACRGPRYYAPKP